MDSKIKPAVLAGGLRSVDGIRVSLNDAFLGGSNSKYRKMYDRMSPGYDFVESLVGRIKYGNAVTRLRNDLMSKIEWRNGFSVLYVSIGTGRNLDFIPSHIDKRSLEIYGADISMGMLSRCRKKFHDRFANLDLMHCCAEDLPYQDDSFDAVVHVGGINFFNDKSRAMAEMARVAKPGSKIILADETSDYLKSQYQGSRLTKKYFQGESIDLSEIEACLPAEVPEKKTELLWDGKFYCLSFRKS